MTSHRLDLEDLELLVQVARAGSIGRVAEDHGISQPTLSRRMDRLERSLRVPLLARSRRGSELTPAGRLVVDWISGLLAAAEEFSRSVSTLRESREAAVRAAVSVTVAEHYAPAWLGRLQARSPDLVVSLAVHNSAKVAELVETGQADLGFVESPSIRRSLQRRRVGWDRLAVAAPPGHPWARPRTPTTAEDLADTKLLVREPGSGTRETLEQALRRHGLELTPGLVMGSNTALKSAALAGMGPVVLSELALEPELSQGRLVEVSVVDVVLRRPLTAIWRHSEKLSSGACALLSAATEQRVARKS